MPISNWCWLETCKCPEQADEAILSRAVEEYFESDYEYGHYYDADGTKDLMDAAGDLDQNGNGLREIQCYWLVANTLTRLGYHAPEQFVWTFWGLWGSPEDAYADHFCKIDWANAGPGDIVDFSVELDAFQDSQLTPYWPFMQNRHVAILANAPVEGAVFNTYSVVVFHAANAADDICYDLVTVDGESGWVMGHAYAQVYRPMRCYTPDECTFPPKPEDARPAFTLDPLVLDLDGDGITTLSQDAGVFFDFDANGFSELSGWIGAGSGLLMLDLNGNGELDDGSELFGDFTMLPTGEHAGNGFHALSQYDDNMDGQIDANDAIWSQLGVYYDTEYYTPESAGGG